MTVQLFKSRAVGVQKASPMSPHGMPAPTVPTNVASFQVTYLDGARPERTGVVPAPPAAPTKTLLGISTEEGVVGLLPVATSADTFVAHSTDQPGSGPNVSRRARAPVGLVKARQCDGCPMFFRPLHGGHGRLCMTCVMRACVAAEVSR